jgi:hypothetical protein
MAFINVKRFVILGSCPPKEVLLMVKNEKKPGKKNIRLPSSMKKRDVGMMEAEAIKKAKNTLDSIEKFLDDWKKMSEPEDNNEEVMRMRRFHLSLNKWYQDAVRANKRKQSNVSRVNRLREFIMLCYIYS